MLGTVLTLGVSAAEPWTRFEGGPDGGSGRLLLGIARTDAGVMVTVHGPPSAVPVSVVRAGTLSELLTHPQVLRTAPLDPVTSTLTWSGAVPDGAPSYLVARWEQPVPNPRPADLIWVAPGAFDRGSAVTELGRDSDEGPVTRVVLTEGFFLGRTEVTRLEYESVMGAVAGGEPGAMMPIQGIAWEDATAYCARLTEQEDAAGRLPAGYAYRLPTESEWEYAARAGAGTRYDFGEDADGKGLGDHAWYRANATGAQAVGLKSANAWGFHDLAGNVAEWCLDLHGSYLGGREVNPRGPTNGEAHVIRGGSFEDDAVACRASARRWDWVPGAGADVGFRVVLAPRNAGPVPRRLEWVRLGPGGFRLGSPPDEPGRQPDEGPQVEVRFPRPFYLSRHEVTQGQYQALMQANPSIHDSGQPDRPVDNVTWDEAMEFCRRLTAHERAAGTLPEGHVVRLPTEAEWEFAARAGTTTPYAFDGDPGGTRSGRHAWHFTTGATRGVGGLEPNAFGFADLFGNVAEWCLDGADFHAGGEVLEPRGPVDSAYRVVRGGGYSDDPVFLRAATRWAFLAPTRRLANVGFRVALAPETAVPSSGIAWVVVPGGEFLMGSPAREAGRNADEGPPTRVTITREFRMSRHEVTQGQYVDVMGVNPSHFNGPLNRPVEQVNWHEAVEFCRRLTERERAAGRLAADFEIRLPTEAEWEYAARAGTGTAYGFGEDGAHALLAAHATFLSGPTTGAGALLPNGWGLHDLHGNVQEWCLDGYGPYPGGAVADPVGVTAGSVTKVTRGGGWGDGWAGCRSAARRAVDPATRHGGIGFRVVLAPAGR